MPAEDGDRAGWVVAAVALEKVDKRDPLRLGEGKGGEANGFAVLGPG
jgi:hypothetical protein